MRKIQKYLSGAVAFTFALLAGPAMAAGTYDSLTAAVNWGEVTTAIVAVGALIAAVLVVRRGVKMILSSIGR